MPEKYHPGLVKSGGSMVEPSLNSNEHIAETQDGTSFSKTSPYEVTASRSQIPIF